MAFSLSLLRDLRGKDIYYDSIEDNKLAIKKLKGSKLVDCKINGKKYIKASGLKNCNIAKGYLVADFNGKLKTYKIK